MLVKSAPGWQSGYDYSIVFSQIDALHEVVQAVKGSGVEVYLDGGVRKGTDILKALAIGAKAVFLGRPVVWGLAYNVSKNLISSQMCIPQCLKLQNQKLLIILI